MSSGGTGRKGKRHALLVSLLLALGLTGCVTPPPSYKTHAKLAHALGGGAAVAIVPLDIEVAEAKAASQLEKRDDWTQLAHANLQRALQSKLGLSEAVLSKEEDASLRREAMELTAMTTLFTLVNAGMLATGHPDIPGEREKPLDFEMGSVEPIAKRLGGDALILVFVRDSYSSAGRKALGALGLVAGAAVGIVIVPPPAPTICSAVAVDREGTVLWINVSGSVGDLRTQPGADMLVEKLFEGLPKNLLKAVPIAQTSNAS